MRLTATLALAAACGLFTLPVQGQASRTKPASKPQQPASKTQQPAGKAHATLADLQRDFQEQKLAALEAYIGAHAKANDTDEALTEAAQLAKRLGKNSVAVVHAERYVADHPEGEAVWEMRMLRAKALQADGNVAAAEAALRENMAKAGEDLRQQVDAATALAELLVDSGKKDDAVKLLQGVADANANVRGLKEHIDGMVANFELIGTEPQAIGQSDIAGKPIDLAEYKGKVVLLDFWATWCGPCVGELPNVLAAYDKYHADGFEIVGISLDQNRGALDKFVAARKMPWRQYFDGKGWQNEVAVAWGVKSIPATYLIDRDGKIAAIGVRGEALSERVEQLLAKGKPAAASDASSSAPAKGKAKK